MALLFADGFDHYGPVNFQGDALRQGVYAETNLGSGGVVVTNPRTGAYALRMRADDAPGVRKVLPQGAEDTVGAGYAFSLSSLPTNNTDLGLLQWRNAENATLATINVSSTGTIIARSGLRGGAIVAESDPVVFTGAYQHFEAVNGPAGLEVRINGVTVVNAPYTAAVAGPIAQIKIGQNGVAMTGMLPVIFDVDDFYIWSGDAVAPNDFLGDKKVYTRFLTSDGPDQGWVPSIGADGYAMIDNAPPQDATEYIQADALGSPPVPIRSTFGVGDFPEEIVSVAGVVLATRIWKTDAGNAAVSVGIDVGGTEAMNPEHSLSMAPIWYNDVFALNPATASLWTLAALNDMDTVLDRVE